MQYVKSIFAACKDLSEKQQLCYILARQVKLCPQLLPCIPTMKVTSFVVNVRSMLPEEAAVASNFVYGGNVQ
jgi:hypothetical protein